MKKVVLSCFLIFSLLILSACGKIQNVQIDEDYIMLSISQNIDGSATQSIVFSVNSDFVRDNSKSIQEELKFKQNLIKNVEGIRNEFLLSFAVIYMQNPIEEYKINRGVLLSQVGYNADGDYVGFELTFTSLGAWQYYHSSNNSLENQEKTSKNHKISNIFFQKQESKGEFPFCSVLSDRNKIGDKYKDCYLKSSQGLSFENIITQNYKPDFVYDYSTYYSKFHSNAHSQFKGNDNKYHHVWVEDDLENCKLIELTIYSFSKGWWIFFALLICLTSMFIAIILLKFKEKKKQI